MSANGRYVAFHSHAANLVPGDQNSYTRDVFLRDRRTQSTILVSLGLAGDGADGDSEAPSLSPDGRFVAFQSVASNLVAGDTNGWLDVFVRDLPFGTTTRVSMSSSNAQGNNLSGSPSISADGQFVAFTSFASTLVAGDAIGTEDVFLRDLVAGSTIRVSEALGGGNADGESWGPSISADGRYVSFTSGATNLVADDTVECLPIRGAGACHDIFVYDRVTGETRLASLNSFGEQAKSASYEAQMAPDGRSVVFWSNANNLVPDDGNHTPDVFVRDLVEDRTELISVTSDGLQAAGFPGEPMPSWDGRLIAFTWIGVPLVPTEGVNSGQVYVRDRALGTTSIISVASDGAAADRAARSPSISSDGRFIAFESTATNLGPYDTNDSWQVWLRDRGEPTCVQGEREEGRLSTAIHDTVEPSVEALSETVHNTSCGLLASRGL